MQTGWNIYYPRSLIQKVYIGIFVLYQKYEFFEQPQQSKIISLHNLKIVRKHNVCQIEKDSIDAESN